jgi:hypothetical protein
LADDRKHKDYRPWDVQSLQKLAEKTSKAMMVMNSNIDILQSLSGYYTKLLKNKDFNLQNSCSDDIGALAAQISDITHDFQTQIGRASDLLKLAQDRKELVCIHGRGPQLCVIHADSSVHRSFSIFKVNLHTVWSRPATAWRS